MNTEKLREHLLDGGQVMVSNVWTFSGSYRNCHSGCCLEVYADNEVEKVIKDILFFSDEDDNKIEYL